MGNHLNYETLQLFLRDNLDLQVQDIYGRTPMHYACQDKLYSRGALLASKLIDAGLDVNKSDNDGWTSLMLAAYNGHTDVCRMLIQHGANCQSLNKQRQTALDLAMEKGHEGVTGVLSEYCK